MQCEKVIVGECLYGQAGDEGSTDWSLQHHGWYIQTLFGHSSQPKQFQFGKVTL